MIILFSTASGRLAIEDAKTRSSYFIKQLCEELKKPERRTIVQESFTLKLKMYLLQVNPYLHLSVGHLSVWHKTGG